MKVDFASITTQEFADEFYPICKEQIHHYITRNPEILIFDNQSFKGIYSDVKNERNKIAHEFLWNNNNFTEGMFVKFLKTYYTIYFCAKKIVA